MKKVLKLIIVFFFALSTFISAKDINVGDLIKLKIKKDITKEKLLKSFEKFEVDEVNEDDDNYYLSFRIYQAGMHKIEVNGAIVNIDVKSLITDDDKDISLEMEENENLKLSDIKPPFPYEILYLIPVLVIVVVIVLFFKKRKIKKKNLSPLQEFNEEISKLDDEEYYYQLSYALRKYIDKVYKSKLLSGKYIETSNILDSETEEFIKKLDQQKFNPFASLSEEKEKTKQKVIDIVNNLELEKGENNGI